MIKQVIEKIESHFDELSVREKIMCFVAMLVVPVLIWDSFYYQSRNAEIVQLGIDTQSLQTKNAAMSQQIKLASIKASNDPDKDTRTELKSARDRKSQAHIKLEGLTSELITPTAMSKVLKEMLEHEEGLTLVQLKSLGTQQLIQQDDDEEKAPAGSIVFSHGIQIEFEGNYLDTLAYLERLESLPWRLYWDALEFETEEYPIAKVRLEVHTLSLAEGWIGV